MLWQQEVASSVPAAAAARRAILTIFMILMCNGVWLLSDVRAIDVPRVGRRLTVLCFRGNVKRGGGFLTIRLPDRDPALHSAAFRES